MQKQSIFKMIFVFIVLVTLLVPPLSQPGLAQDQVSPLMTTTAETGNLTVDGQRQELWVVRVYFTDRQQVDQIAAWIEPWEVNYQEGYLVIDVTANEFSLLVAQGYQVVVDQKLTELVNRPLEYLPGQVTGIPGYACYRTVEETFTSAADLAASHPDLAEWIDIGDSWEKTQPGGLPGYEMMVLRLTNENIPGDKPKLFVMGAIHAREYTTAELVTRFAEYLINNYDVDPDVTWLLDYTEIHLLLQSNPDGRKIAETGDYWRKNTDNDDGCSISSSWGTDLNRNFEFEWGNWGGSSGDPCSETYRGPSAGSEPETQAVQNYVTSIFPDQRGPNLTDPAPDNAMGIFLDIHSYSQLVLWSWGFIPTPAPNGTQLQTLGRKFAYFNSYTPQQAYQLYATDGTTKDFAYGDLGLAGYTIELGTDFFQDCASFENTILPDNLPVLLYAAKASRTPYMTPSGPDALDVTALPNVVGEGDLVTLEATINDTRYQNNNGTEPTQNIAAAAYYVDISPWETGAITQTMSAADGNFNSPIEDVVATIDTTGLSSGRHIVFVRGQDAAGNWGAISAVFLYVIDPSTAPTIQGYVREAVTNNPLDATVSASGLFQTNTEPATGFYQMYVISGTYDLAATAAGHGMQIVSGVVAYDTQTVIQDFSLYPVCTAFSDNVESGNIGWSAQSPWAITTESSHSPTHSWTDSPGGNYGNNRNISLTSPTIDLSGFSDVHLDFWQICNTEAGWDYCHVEVSDDNGASWTEIGTYDGTHTFWENIVLPAAILDNQPDARIRFRLTTDTNTTRDGWHVDDIQITGAGASCIVYTPPTAGFTSSSPDALGSTTVFTNTSAGEDLSYEWDFGDLGTISLLENPTHTYTTTGVFTVTLTVTDGITADTYSDQVYIYDPADAQILLDKNVSVSEIQPGEWMTYTLEAQLVFTGTNPYSLVLTDTLPAEVLVLTDSIQLNGLPTPDLYISETHSILYQASGTFTDTHEVGITFQVQVGSEVISGTLITNLLDGQATINGEPTLPPQTAETTTHVIVPWSMELFLPVVIR